MTKRSKYSNPSIDAVSDGEGTVIRMTQSGDGTYVPTKGQVYAERYVAFEDGMPVLKYRNVIRKEALNELTRHALSQQYEGDWDPEAQQYVIDPRFVGMTKAEVIEHKLVDKAAAGNVEAIREIKDRLMGKPKQQVESKNLNITYEDFLEELARTENLANDNETISDGPLDL